MQIKTSMKVTLNDIQEISLMERNMEMAFIIIQLEENLEVNGSKIRKMDTESFNMLIMIDTKAIG